MDKLEDYKQQLEELKALRERLTSVETIEDTRENSTEIRKNMLDELNSIDESIKKIEAAKKELSKKYEKAYKKMQEAMDAIIDFEISRYKTEEEIAKYREETEELRLAINEESIGIRKQFDTQTKMIRDLKARKTRIENSIKSAEALGLTFSEYKEIHSKLKNTTLMNRILEKKGLADIINKPAKERTKEEEALLKQTKEEILKEVAGMRKKDEHVSILDGITAIYSLDTTIAKKEEPQEIKIKKNELMVISQNKSLQVLPHKVVSSNTITNIATLAAAPKDMEGATRNVKVDISKLRPLDEKVTIFKNKDTDEYYVRKYALNKLELIPISGEIRINGSSCYKISESDVAIIAENGKNKEFPYITDIKEVDLSKDNKIAPEVKTEPQTTPSTEAKTEVETTPSTEATTEATTEAKTDPNSVTKEEVEEAIREKLKAGKDKDDKLKAKNVKASKKFKLELKEGTLAYNIVHKVPKIAKAFINGSKFVFGKIKKFLEEGDLVIQTIREYNADNDELEEMMNDKTTEEDKETKAK